MSDKVYRKDGLRAEGKNRIVLSAREQLALRDELDRHIIQHKISGLSQELIHIVFHKTIRHNKREDDLNGVCIGNLTSTGSRSDYINKHVTNLIAQSVLISRLGHHGRILSINFNSKQWGKSPEYNRENAGLNSDPEALLATLDIPPEAEEIEETEALQEPSNAHASHEHSVSNAPAWPNQEQEMKLSVNALSALLADNIPANIAMLITEDFLKQALHKLIDVIVPLIKDNPIIDMIINHFKPQMPPETAPEHTPETPIPAEKHDKTITPTIPISAEKHEKTRVPAIPISAEKHEKTIALEIPISPDKTEKTSVPEIPQTPKAAEKPITSEPKTEETNTTADYEQLIFPTAVKPFEQTQIKNILEKESITDLGTVQSVLNSMSSRYQVDMEPIKSPIAYFRSLLKSAQQGVFDNSYAEIYQQQCAAKEQQEKTTSEQQNSREYKEKYNEAHNNYKQLKLYLKLSDKSMYQLAKDLGWLALLEEMGFDLDKQATVKS